MKAKPQIITTALIAVCFLYTGSVYMSQYMRLMDFYTENTVDLITSVIFYLLQAAGIAIFMIGLRKKPNLVGSKRLFIILMAAGVVLMAISQLTTNGMILSVSGCIFNLLIGVYFGFYLALLAREVPQRHAAICFGIAYAIGSVGTYLFSLIRDGQFLVSKEITVVYILLAVGTCVLAFVSEDLICERGAFLPREDLKKNNIIYQMPIVAIMTIISVVGSGLYYSMPTAANVNWNLIRAFYAIGLILAGFIMDRSRMIGEIVAVASLTYPLIALSLIGDGVANTTAMSLSYVFRGFFTIYYIVAFTDAGAENEKFTYLAPLGLGISRIVEAITSIFLIYMPLPNLYQLIISAGCFLPLLILFVLVQKARYEKVPVSDEKRMTLFAERYQLTSREMEIVNCLAENLTDTEISEKLFISKNTVRFHISNILKKTKTTSRVEVSRLLRKF